MPSHPSPWSSRPGTRITSFTPTSPPGARARSIVNDDFASGQHARFKVARDLWYIEDLGSTNGTWLNGRRIHAAQLLKKGDKIKIGHVVLIVMST